MADNIVKTRISLRTDTVENWTANKDVVLLDGEMAVVIDGDSQRLKIGDGQRTFENLPYIADKFVAKDLFARSIAQGYRTSAIPTGLAAGAYAEVSGNFGTAHGVQAQVLSGDNYAFVYNGVSLDGLNSRYESHGEGTFSINPVGGMAGFYIGEDNVSSIISSEIQNKSKVMLRSWSEEE